MSVRRNVTRIVEMSIGLGDISNILSLLQLAGTILQRLEDYDSCGIEPPLVVRNIAKQLPLFMEDLERLRNTPTLLTPAMATAVEGCKAEVESLNVMLNQVLPKKGTSRARRVIMAALSLLREKDIDASWKEVQCYRAGLTPHIITSTAIIPDDLATSPHIFDIPPLHVPNFIQRPVILNRIRKLFESGGHMAESDHSTIVCLIGMGGQGKTQLALEFCRMTKASGLATAIFWLDASSRNSALRGMEAIAERLSSIRVFDSCESARDHVRETLSNRAGEWLLVIDNFNCPDEFPDIRSFIPESKSGRVLFASRHRGSEQLGAAIHVDRMEEEECIRLLLPSSPPTGDLLHTVKQVAERLGYLPLAIDQARAYIAARKLPISDFIAEYDTRKRRILQEAVSLTPYRRSLSTVDRETALNVFTTWEMSLQQLAPFQGDREVLLKVLTLLSFFHHVHISEHIFGCLLDALDGRDLNPMSAFFSGDTWDHLEFEDAILQMHALSLLQISQESSSEMTITIHPLVSDWLKLRIDPEMQTAYVSLGCRHLERHLKSFGTSIVDFDTRRRLLLHIDTLLSHRSSGSVRSTFHQALYRFGLFYIECSHLESAERTFNRILQGFSESPEHARLTLEVYGKLGVIYREQGRYKEAEEMLNRAQRGAENDVGFLDELTLQIISDLGVLYRWLGRFEDAERMYSRALVGREKLLGATHPKTLETINHLGIIYRERGQFDDAGRMFNRALDGKQESLGHEHPSTLHTVNQLGTFYRMRGRFDESQEMYSRALLGREKALGPMHPLTLQTVNNVGLLYWSRGCLDEAESKYKRALIGMEEVLGPQHPWTLGTVFNISMLWRDQGRLDDAESGFLRTLTGRMKAIGVQHPETLQTAYQLRCLKVPDHAFLETPPNQERWHDPALDTVIGAVSNNGLISLNYKS